MPRALLPIVIAAALLVACTGGDDRPTSSVPTRTPAVTATVATPQVTETPSPPLASTREPPPTSVAHVPFVDGRPVGVSGPLVVYSGQVGVERTPGRSWRVIEVAAFELDGERPISSFRVGREGDYPSEWLLVGHEVLFNLEHTLVAYYLDGSISRVVRGGGDTGLRFHSALLSPDGTTIVFAESGAPECGALACVVFLDVATGDEVRVFPTDPVLAELGGQFAQPVTWLGDGSGVVVRGQPNGHAFAGTATVMLDGSVVPHPGLRGGDVAPGGRFFLERGEFVDSWIADELGCSLYSDLAIFDLDSGAVVATVATPGLAIRRFEWSPDGGELLYGARTLPDPESGSCSFQFNSWDELPHAWRLLDLGSNTSAPVDDPQAVRDRWAGEHAVRFNCTGELKAFSDTNDRRYLRCFDAEGERIDATLEVDGIAVAVGPYDRVFGFVEFGGGSTPEPPPAVEFVDGLPAGAVGPLVVYARVARTERSEDRTWTTWVIATYDIETRKTVAEFEVGEVGTRADLVGLNGTDLLVRIDNRLVALDLAGRELRTLHAVADGQGMPNPLVSPDGSMLVFAELREGCERFCVVVIDAESGDELLSVPQSAAGLATLGGYSPQPRAWRDDGRGVVVVGQPNGHRLFGLATVSLDGSVRNHGVEALFSVSPNGRRLVTFEGEIDFWRIDGLGCEVYGALGLRDLDSDRVLSIIGREGWRIGMGRLAWSPGGDQLLVALQRLPEPGGSCSERFEEFDDAPVEWLLVETETGVATPVKDSDSVDAPWLDTPRVSILCQGVERNLGSLRSFGCTDTDRNRIDADLTYGGSYVGSGDRLWVLGVIEVGTD